METRRAGSAGRGDGNAVGHLGILVHNSNGAGQPHLPSGPMQGIRVGHTFTKDGSHNTHELTMEATNSGRPIGQWLDDVAAEQFIASKLLELAQGAKTFDLSPGLGRQINPDGTFSPANKVTLVPSKTGVKTAYPFAE